MDLDVAVKGIVSVRKRIQSSWENPVELSDLGNKMATYKSYLGDHLGALKEERETTKGRLYLKGLEEGMSATGADNNARAQVAELTGSIDRLELTHKDANQQVMMIQSRLKVLESQLRGDF